MLFPGELRKAFADENFWTSYFFDDWYVSGLKGPEFCLPENADLLGETPIEFPLGKSFALQLLIEGDLSYVNLALTSHESGSHQDVGWDDMAHWHPHVLRWDELELMCRLAALANPELPHPGVPLLLLARFAPILEETADVAFPMTESAWRSVDCPARCLNARTRQFDCRGRGFEWQYREPGGWTLFQSEEANQASGFDLYTLRHAENDSFPAAEWRSAFAAALQQYHGVVDPNWLSQNGGTARDLLERCIATEDLAAAADLARALEGAGCTQPTILQGLRSATAAQIGWILELLSHTEIGSVLRRLFGATGIVHRPQSRYVLRLKDSVDRCKARLPSLAEGIAKHLDAELRLEDVGSAQEGYGTGAYKNNELVEVTGIVNIILYGSLESGLHFLRGALRRCDLPINSVLLHRTEHGPEAISLD